MTGLNAHSAATDARIPEYPKLIRDKVPEVIAKNEGRQAATRTLDDDAEFLRFLLKKIVEEANEVSRAENTLQLTEEIADVHEVLAAILKLKGIALDDVRNAQKKKREERGGFEKRLLMLHNDLSA